MKKLKILAKTYDLKNADTEEMSMQFHDDEQELMVFGLHKTFQNEIWLNTDIGDQQRLITLTHECLHAILSQLGYDDINTDEMFVTGVSTALTQLLLDNPKLTKMYLK